MRTLTGFWSVVIAGAVVTAACGDAKSSLNPTAPSAVSAAVQEDASGAGAGAVSGTTANGPKPGNGNGNGGNGNGNGNSGGGNGNGNGNQPTVPGSGGPPSNTSPTAPGRSKVEIEGLISAVGAGTITVNGQTVLVPADTVIRHGQRRFELNELNVGDRVHVRAQRLSAGENLLAASLEATEIMLQNAAGGDDDGEEPDPTDLVSVSAFDASASETGGNTGTFRLTRAGDLTLLASPLTVTFTLTGSATNGTDYANLPLTATFAAGSATADVVVTPIADAAAEGPETVILTLTSVAPYELGSPLSATVTITDTVNPLVSVVAFDATASEAGDTGLFRLSRTGDTSAALSVTVTYTGTATNGVDYDLLPTTVTFAAGSATANVIVVPVADATVDPSETVILTVVDGATYDLGATPSATVTITGS